MFAAKNHESSKTKAEKTPAPVNAKGETAERVQVNPLWNLLATGVQAKLTVSAPDDPYEREADRVADQVMRMPQPVVQRACPACAAGGPPCPKCQRVAHQVMRMPESNLKPDRANAPTGSLVQRKVTGRSGPGIGTTPSIGQDVLSSQGQPLDAATRAFFEPRFGHDFSNVRVHADNRATESAQSINARAYTLEHNVVFGAGQYEPGTTAGQRLLAHELTHVVQQQGSIVTPRIQRRDGIGEGESTISGPGMAELAPMEDVPPFPSEQVGDYDFASATGKDLWQRVQIVWMCIAADRPKAIGLLNEILGMTLGD